MNQQSNNNNNKNQSEIPNDNILAILLEMFGDALSTNLIIKIGSQSNWDIDACVEKLIRYSNDPSAVSLMGGADEEQQTQKSPPLSSALENLKIAYSEPNQQLQSDGVDVEQDDENADILIEREEIHGGNGQTIVTVAAPIEKQQQSYSKMLSSVSSWQNNSTAREQPTSSSSNNYSRGSYNNRSVSKPNIGIGQQKFNQLIEAIGRGYKVMVLMRGAPGSGKSYLARELCDMTVLSTSADDKKNYRHHIFSTDDYFLNPRGRYFYDKTRLTEAHTWNQERVRKFATNQWSPIIVDNTNMTLWEMLPYVQIAVQHGYLVEFLDAYTAWCKSAGKLAMRNSHNVPKDKIQIILQKYEPISVDDFFRSFNLRYVDSVPQVRSFPPMILNNPQSQQIGAEVVAINQSTEPIIDESDTKIQDLVEETIWDSNWGENNENIQHLPTIDPNCPKPERINAPPPPQRLVTTTQATPSDPYSLNYADDDEPIKLPDKNIDWMKHENELIEFWNYNTNSVSTAASIAPTFHEKPTSLIDQSNDQNSKIFSILKKDRLQPIVATESITDDPNIITENQRTTNDEINQIQVLNKHRKNCINENKSFAQIRQIYPSVPHSYLWDLFKNCNGDGDWTMDILLKEETTTGIYNGNNDEKLNEDKYFNCKCDKPLELFMVDRKQEETSGLIDVPIMNTLLSSNNRRREKNLQQLEETKRQIEESFVIGDEYYSEHTRKIRNIRHGNIGGSVGGQQQQHLSPPPPPPLAVITNFSGGEEAAGGGTVNDTTYDEQNENSSTEDDEILEIDLGIELIQQLDQSFGIDAFQNDSFKDVKTTVFMPKSFAQQLYAIWMESLYNQIEEQRQHSIKCDEEFARRLHEVEEYQHYDENIGGNSQTLTDTGILLNKPSTTTTTTTTNTPKQKSNIQDIIDMELAFAAYKSQKIEDSWKNPKDLASQMTINKLVELFPEIEKDTLAEVFQAHGNQFDETVLYLNKSQEITQQQDNNLVMEQKRQELMAQAEAETEQVIKRAPFLLIVNHNKQKNSVAATVGTITAAAAAAATTGFNIGAAQKLVCDENAKSAALIDFEDCRNMAQHHTQLKAECYRKAQDAIQKQNTSVALYYSQIANLHKVKIDLYNQKAANLIMEVHNLTQNNPDMLDLHYLHVAEAVQCLDIFLDHHIHRLITCRNVYRYILVITGRGLHSAGGFSTIKQRAKQRLKERGLKWTEVNPGLLKVKIHIQSRLSNDM